MQGIQGVKGDKGDQGETGPQGPQGEPGPPTVLAIQSGDDLIGTTTTEFIDMKNMTITLVLDRKSHILIMVSIQSIDYVDKYIRALMDGEEVEPGIVGFTGFACCTYNFYWTSISSGTYIIKIQWHVTGDYGGV